MSPAHLFRARCSWTGSTRAGYEHYARTHRASCPPARTALTLSADRSFRGDPDYPNPEQLVVLAAASCQLLSFLAVAARARVDVVFYEDEAEGVMAEDQDPIRLTVIRLRPRITVGAGTGESRVHDLVEVAHRQCYVANSLECQVEVDALVRET